MNITPVRVFMLWPMGINQINFKTTPPTIVHSLKKYTQSSNSKFNKFTMFKISDIVIFYDGGLLLLVEQDWSSGTLMVGYLLFTLMLYRKFRTDRFVNFLHGATPVVEWAVKWYWKRLFWLHPWDFLTVRMPRSASPLVAGVMSSLFKQVSCV